MKRHEIRVVVPIVMERTRLNDALPTLDDPDTKVTTSIIESGPASIEGNYDEAFSLPETIRLAIAAERDGCDAIVINCMGDPAVKAAREAVQIPVFGPSETSMHIAATLGHRFSVVTVLDNLRSLFENMVAVYGTGANYASTRSVNIPVLELHEDEDRMIAALTRESIAAIEEDHAHVIIFGCTGMVGCAEGLKAGLEKAGHGGVPVIDPIPATVRYAAAMVRAGLSHSKKTYPNPRPKPIAGYGIEAATGIAAE